MPTIKDVTWNLEAATMMCQAKGTGGTVVTTSNCCFSSSSSPGVPFLAQVVFLHEILAHKCTEVQAAKRVCLISK